MTTTITPTIAAALDRLLTVLRALPLIGVAADIGRAITLGNSRDIRRRLGEADVACHDFAVQAMYSAANVAVRDGRIAAAHLALQARSATTWLVRAVIVAEDEAFGDAALAHARVAGDHELLRVAAVDHADALAGEALRLLAWPEAMATLDAATKLVEAPATPSDNPTVIEVIRAMGGLDAAVQAHREAIGQPMATTTEEREQARDAMVVEADAGRFTVTKIETWTAGEWTRNDDRHSHRWWGDAGELGARSACDVWPFAEWTAMPGRWGWVAMAPWGTVIAGVIGGVDDHKATEAEARAAADEALGKWCAAQEQPPASC